MVSSKIMYSMDRVNMTGRMVEFMRGNGNLDRWMDKGYSLGWMVENMKVGIGQIQNMAKEL